MFAKMLTTRCTGFLWLLSIEAFEAYLGNRTRI